MLYGIPPIYLIYFSSFYFTSERTLPDETLFIFGLPIVIVYFSIHRVIILDFSLFLHLCAGCLQLLLVRPVGCSQVFYLRFGAPAVFYSIYAVVFVISVDISCSMLMFINVLAFVECDCTIVR
ncbi:26S proteasome regulatory subunit RPN1 [Frankliniella fusca]|uniref:26S proteasome regulatory subunit RPN1 n=1 Tax=Frankliniella fusca TaxID=407009 RepID=A0AAE1GZ26_9NEOP|nr:26S proteasome regulatory subunit RPN1 [Frankliniella fusca]